jgi:predicted PurR-regulated permease PerM
MDRRRIDHERVVQWFFFGLMAVTAWAVYQLLTPFLTPIAWAAMLAFIAHPALVWLDHRLKRRSLSATIISLVVGLGIVMPAIWMSGRMAVEAQSLYAQAEEFVKADRLRQFQDWAEHSRYGAMLGTFMAAHGYKIDENIGKFAMQGAQAVSNYAISNATSAARNVASFVFDFGIALMVFFYLLRDGDSYYQSIRELTPLHEDDKAAVFDTLRHTLSSVIRGLMLTAILQGIAIGIGLLVFHVPYWLFLGLGSAIAGMMPIGGTALIWIPAAAWLGFSTGWSHAIGLTIWCGACLVVIDNFIKPLAMRRGTTLSTMALFMGILGGIELFGPLGLFLGPAIISIFASLLEVYRKTYGEDRASEA